MRPAGRAAVQATALAAVAVLAVGGAFTLLDDDGDRAPAAAGGATGAARISAGAAPGLTTGTPAVELRGEELVLVVPVRNGEADPAEVTAVSGLPTGMRAVLPAGGLRVPARGEAQLPLHWTGPDCAVALPERVVDDLTWEGTPGGGLPGGPVDEVARAVWLDTCAGRPSEGGVPREEPGT